MQKASRIYYDGVLSLIILIVFNSFVLAQNKIDLLVGVGIPELLNFGINVQNNQTQLGIRIGSWPTDTDEKIISISGNFYYHFMTISKWSKRRLWFVKCGLNYLRDETKTTIDQYVYFQSRIGRDFYFLKTIGIELDAGLMFQLLHQEKQKRPLNGWNFNISPPLLPCIGIALFYRF